MNRSVGALYILLLEPVVLDGLDVLEPEPLAFMASNTDIPCGPMVITTGFPSFDFACTTNDSATTLTSVKPAFFRSCSILLAAARFWSELADGCDVVELEVVEFDVGDFEVWLCANAVDADRRSAMAEADASNLMRCPFMFGVSACIATERKRRSKESAPT